MWLAAYHVLHVVARCHKKRTFNYSTKQNIHYLRVLRQFNRLTAVLLAPLLNVNVPCVAGLLPPARSRHVFTMLYIVLVGALAVIVGET